MRRVVSLWLPAFAIERRRRQPSGTPASPASPASPADPAGPANPADPAGPAAARDREARPLALVARDRGRLLLAAVDDLAAAAGLAPGLPLAGAHALAPALATAPYDGAGDAAALARLAAWCERYSPWTAPGGLEPGGLEPGGAAGLLLDVTGCAHLFGGEAALLADLETRLARLGFTARGALAGTLGAAWALARFAPRDGGPILVPPGRERPALAALPPAALRLPAETCELLARLGLRRVGDLIGLPPAVLAPRFGRGAQGLARRLGQALGTLAEPLSPGAPPPPPLARRLFAEPISSAEDLARGLEDLSRALCRRLEARGLGARRLAFTAYRVDGSRQCLTLATSRPSRDPRHLTRLFRDKLEGLDPGFGIDALSLAAPLCESLAPRQLVLAGGCAGDDEPGLAALVDRLESRLGPGRVFALAPRQSHLPERAVVRRPALAAAAPVAAWQRANPRPLRLFDPPEPVEALALLPDHPPSRFRWRRLQHRVVRTEGPERLLEEWWRGTATEAPAAQTPEAVPGEPAARDYFRVEDEAGRRYWLYRADGRWFLHGLFG